MTGIEVNVALLVGGKCTCGSLSTSCGLSSIALVRSLLLHF